RMQAALNGLVFVRGERAEGFAVLIGFFPDPFVECGLTLPVTFSVLRLLQPPQMPLGRLCPLTRGQLPWVWAVSVLRWELGASGPLASGQSLLLNNLVEKASCRIRECSPAE